MNDFLAPIARSIAAVGVANPLALFDIAQDWQPLVKLVVAGFLMSLIVLLPSIMEALGRCVWAIQGWLALVVRRRHAPSYGGVRAGGWRDVHRHPNHWMH
jgi:hypothetical protein